MRTRANPVAPARRPRRRGAAIAIAAVALGVAGILVAPSFDWLWARYEIAARGLGADARREPGSEGRIRGAQVVDAACGRRSEHVLLFLRAGYPADGRSYGHDLTALHCAAFWGEIELIRELTARGSPVGAATAELALQPIHLAALNAQPQTVALLKELGAEIDAPSGLGTPLLLAFSGAPTNPLSSPLLRELRKLIGEGQSAREIRARDIALLDDFVALGAQLDGTNERGQTLAHLAIEQGDIELLRELLRRGLDADARDSERLTPLLRAARINAGNGKAVKQHLVRVLLDAGADVNARDQNGLNAFCPARVDIETLVVLLEAGLDPNVGGEQDGNCWRTLRRDLLPDEIMRLADRVPSLKTPLRADGSPGAGPLLAFASETEADLVEYFLRRGLRPIERDDDGYGVMHAALRSSGGVGDHEATRERMVRLLIEAGADLNERTDRGQTPLMMGRAQPASLIRLVIEHGADVNAIDPSTGRSVLDIFERSGNTEAAAVLRAAGARSGAGPNARRLR